MRVVSFVPSWTETLLQAGVNVVGRTRFCIHPREQIARIPVVGGTKDWQLERVRQLKPDLLILDREENPKFMAEEVSLPFLATHVDSIEAVAPALERMAERLSCAKLVEIAARWQRISEWSGVSAWKPGDEIPGLIEWGERPEKPVQRVLYVIWPEPWMAVSKTTFIGSVLAKCGFGMLLPEFAEKYPKLELQDFPPDETLLLFSSEPYPFLRKREELRHLPNPYALVDGEMFSWFGVRTLGFLESLRDT